MNNLFHYSYRKKRYNFVKEPAIVNIKLYPINNLIPNI